MKLKNKRGACVFKAAMAIAVSGACVTALAQTDSDKEPSVSGVRMGPMTAYPSLDLRYRHDDNIFQAPNEKKSWITVITPAVQIVARSMSGVRLGANLMVEDGRYQDSSADDYTDQRYSVFGDISGNSMGFKASAETAKLHDQRTLDSVGGLVVSAPNKYDQNQIKGMFSIGTLDSGGGRLELEAGQTDKQYTNNRLLTRSFDRKNTDYGATFYWKVAPKTQLLAQVKETEIKYDLSHPTPTTSSLDSKEQRGYLGVKWFATAKTTGAVKIGHVKKDFDASAYQDFSGSSWDIDITWQPLTYSTVNFTSSKQTDESSGNGNALLTKNHQLVWSHNWSDRFLSQVMLGRQNTEYLGITREDRLTTSGIKLMYKMRRWLDFAVDFTHDNRDSTLSPFEYKRNVTMFTVTGRM